MMFLRSIFTFVLMLGLAHAASPILSPGEADALLKPITAETGVLAKRKLLRKFIDTHDDVRFGTSSEEYEYVSGRAVGLLLQSAKDESEFTSLANELIAQNTTPRARAFALKALADHKESLGKSAEAKELYEHLAGPIGEHEIIWNETFAGYAKQKLWAASPAGIKAAHEATERAAAWERERANRIPASPYAGPGKDPRPREELIQFGLISVGILAAIFVYVAVRLRRRRDVP